MKGCTTSNAGKEVTLAKWTHKNRRLGREDDSTMISLLLKKWAMAE